MGGGTSWDRLQRGDKSPLFLSLEGEHQKKAATNAWKLCSHAAPTSGRNANVSLRDVAEGKTEDVQVWRPDWKHSGNVGSSSGLSQRKRTPARHDAKDQLRRCTIASTTDPAVAMVTSAETRSGLTAFPCNVSSNFNLWTESSCPD